MNGLVIDVMGVLLEFSYFVLYHGYLVTIFYVEHELFGEVDVEVEFTETLVLEGF